MDMNSIGKLISFINRINQKELANKLRDYNIGGGGHHSYLKTILMNPGLNQDQLTCEVKFDKATTTRCIRQLEEEGYVERIVDDNDRRSYRLYPTTKAKEFEPVLISILDESNRSLAGCLSEEEKEQLRTLLQKVYDNYNSR